LEKSDFNKNSDNSEIELELFREDDDWIRACIEAILFISDRAVRPEEIADAIDLKTNQVKKIIENLRDEYIEKQRGYIIKKVGKGYRFFSNPSVFNILKRFVKSNISSFISQAALETLAIIAYKQPVTRTQIAEIRGVRADSVVITLVDKGLVKEAGKLKEPGNPIIYKTTDGFLEVLGIGSLKELPPLELFKDYKKDENS
jgi:segregation and condensation protein B